MGSLTGFRPDKEMLLWLCRAAGPGAAILFPGQEKQTPEAALEARSRITDSGLAELDFDGKLHIGAELGRLIDTLKHAKAAARFMVRGTEQILGRGGVEVLHFEAEGKVYRPERLPMAEAFRTLMELDASDECFSLEVLDENGSTERFPERSVKELADSFFRMKAEDAPRARKEQERNG